MTKKEILRSKSLLKRFCKDAAIPIDVFEEPIFSERLKLFDPIYGTRSKFDRFVFGLKDFKNEEEYFSYYADVKDKVIQFIKDSPGYRRFNEDIYRFETSETIRNKAKERNLFSSENSGKTFVSADMICANFSVMNYYYGDIFQAESWEAFIGRFTDNAHIIGSKYIRNVIFGACNPKRQINLESSVTEALLRHISENLDADVFSLSNDEIILNVGGFSFLQFEQCVKNAPGGIGSLFRCQMFGLLRVDGTSSYRKTIYTFDYSDDAKDTVMFKCLDPDIAPQVIRYYLEEPIAESDLVFRHKDSLVKYLYPIEDPFSI